jgi:hypothetical protein
MNFETPEMRGIVKDRVDALVSDTTMKERTALTVAFAEQIFGDFNGVSILDIACGHDIWGFQLENNNGPRMAEYLASQGAKVVGLDEWHLPFKKYAFTKKWGMAQRIANYFAVGEFDLITSMAYFGSVSSRGFTTPSYNYEYGTLQQALTITKPKGFGIHSLQEGRWELDTSSLKHMGYTIDKYLDPKAGDVENQEEPKLYDNVIVLQK